MDKAVLDAATAHFKKRRDLRGPILVPEWTPEGRDELEIWYRVSNLEERREVYALLNAGDLEGFATALILLARGSDGKRIFAKGQRSQLMKDVDPDVMMRVVNEMRADEDLDPDQESLKNS